MDFMANLLLLLVPVQDAYFYLFNLTVSVFSMKNFKNDENHFYIYDETMASKVQMKCVNFCMIT